MAATQHIQDPFRALTCRTLIGLLASTGMRVGEAIGLDQTHLDSEQGVITVRNGKFGKSREVPLHPMTLDALGDYPFNGTGASPGPRALRFFLSLAGRRLILSERSPHLPSPGTPGWSRPSKAAPPPHP